MLKLPFKLGGNTPAKKLNNDKSKDSKRRQLIIELIAARELVACNSDATSDPYIIMSIQKKDAEMRFIDIVEEAPQESSHKKRTIEPVWLEDGVGEMFSFGMVFIC
jgi:hypothetical protein